jgi:hypothetical protein
MEIFDNVVCAIMQGNILEIMNTFMDSHSDRFSNDRDTQGADYTGPQFESYQQFCDIIEDRVIQVCTSLSVDPKSFIDACRDNIAASPAVDTFAKILLISTEFQLYDDVMRDREKRKYMFKIWRDWSNTLACNAGHK